MGVTGLWTVVAPCARPIKIETLNKKRLAVDASIWIYQFLKAVRDKEGNALRNSHVVGFFRRICKLLFYGIKPVFVFDGGAPALKRQTIAGRKARREGRRDDAVRTAGKLLALQMQRRAEEEEQKRRDAAARPAQADGEEAVKEDELVYVDELQMTQQERQQNRRTFKKKDQYHLPELDVPLAEMGGPNDPRVMSMEELQHYARQFDTGEDINVYDFSKIDFESPFFTSLPATDRYNILNAARLRSRLRMGYSKDQLDTMFPDRMAFSKFQIDRVRERNELTQRLMAVGTADEMLDAGGRVAGEKGREYVLVKNPGVEGGWALGVISERDKQEGQRSKPIDVDSLARKAQLAAEVEEESSDEGEPEISASQENEEVLKRRQAFYEAQKAKAGIRRSRTAVDGDQEDGLFVGQEERSPRERPHGAADSEEESEIQKAIAMSLEKPGKPEKAASAKDDSGSESGSDDEFYDKLVEQSKAQDFKPFAGLSSGGFAHLANKRAAQAVPKQPQPDSSDEEDDMHIDKVIAKSRQPKAAFRTVSTDPAFGTQKPSPQPAAEPTRPKAKGFDGPLPFERLDLGSSLLGKKKMQEIQEKEQGGFEKDDESEKRPEPMPPWFEGELKKDLEAQRNVEHEDVQRNQQLEHEESYTFQQLQPRLRQRESPKVIDVDAEDDRKKRPIFVESSDEDDEDEAPPARSTLQVEDQDIRMGDMADAVRANPPAPAPVPSASPTPPIVRPDGEREPDASGGEGNDDPLDWEASDAEGGEVQQTEEATPAKTEHGIDARLNLKRPRPLSDEDSDADEGMDARLQMKRQRATPKQQAATPPQASSVPDAEPSRPNSETNAVEPKPMANSNLAEDKGITGLPTMEVQQSPAAPEREISSHSDTASEGESDSDRSSSPEVYIPEDMDEMVAAAKQDRKDAEADRSDHAAPVGTDGEISLAQPASGLANEYIAPEDAEDYGEDFSDPEDEELLANLANEAEEHARFASTLNQKSYNQNIEEYERELKALRSQQKRDRRDADEVTHIMITECQQLLKLFGLPFITAPMEAEAQCAELVRLGLVDGIVTDDSDCFLFGGTRIYKNMFNAAKFVECYLASDLERDFDLTRQRLIRIAHLLGSDYTEGLPGIGPVTALEIVSEFPDGLEGFRDWWSRVQMADTSLSASDAQSAFRKKFRRNASKLFLPPAFPDARVDVAYAKPEVDSDASPFQWGVPDLTALRAFLMATIGWSPERTDEVLVPVIRDMNRREQEGTQANITQFIGVSAPGAQQQQQQQQQMAFAPRARDTGKSKRLKSALDRMADRAKSKRRAALQQQQQQQQSSDGDEVAPEDAVIAMPGSMSGDLPVASMGAVAEEAGSSQRRKKERTSRKRAVTRAEAEDDEDDDADDGEASYEPPKKAKRRPGRGAKTKKGAAL